MENQDYASPTPPDEQLPTNLETNPSTHRRRYRRKHRRHWHNRPGLLEQQPDTFPLNDKSPEQELEHLIDDPLQPEVTPYEQEQTSGNQAELFNETLSSQENEQENATTLPDDQLLDQDLEQTSDAPVEQENELQDEQDEAEVSQDNEVDGGQEQDDGLEISF